MAPKEIYFYVNRKDHKSLYYEYVKIDKKIKEAIQKGTVKKFFEAVEDASAYPYGKLSAFYLSKIEIVIAADGVKEEVTRGNFDRVHMSDIIARATDHLAELQNGEWPINLVVYLNI